MCFDSTFSYPHKEFLTPRPPRTKYNLHQVQTTPEPARIAVHIANTANERFNS